MSWDPLQRAVLVDLGHVLYRASGTVTAAPAATEDAAAVAAVTAAPDDALLARLARAACVTPEVLRGHADIAAAAATLRGDAAAKRALWPRLRALRRGGT